MAEEEDPFGMGAPPLAEPAGDGFDMAGMADAPPLSDDLPVFGDAPPPAMPAMDGGMGAMGGMGGMDASAFMAPPGGEMGPVAKWRIENSEKVSAKSGDLSQVVQRFLAEMRQV